MPLESTPLPFDYGALEPHLSAEAVEAHHRQQQTRLQRVAAAVAGGALAEASLADIVRKAQGPVFDDAAQAWNEAFYWAGLKPVAAGGGGEPTGAIKDAIARNFGDPARLRQQFDQAALRLFGAGWAWLLKRRSGGLAIAVTANAATPLTGEDTPLLACCLWEHAYYLDYRDARAKYLAAFWHLVDWDTVAARMPA